MADITLEEDLKPLTTRQAAFVQEYLVDGNGAQAAIRAGYSAHTAREIASELLRKPHVTRRMEAAVAQRAERVRVNPDTVLHEMSLLATSDVSHYRVDQYGEVQLVDGAPEGAMRAVQSIKRKIRHSKDREGNSETTYEVELKLWDKPTPLKLMGRHVGLFPDRVEHKHSGTVEAVTRVERVIRAVAVLPSAQAVIDVTPEQAPTPALAPPEPAQRRLPLD